MSREIILYDIVCKIPGRTWSPNVWKSRYSLNYKRLPFKTVWLECPEIQETLKGIGAPPTEQRPDGTWKYTCPTIHDPNTGKIIAGSIEIAEYLDEQYPEKPILFPPGTKALQSAYLTAYRVALPSIYGFIYPQMIRDLNPSSRDWYIAKVGGEDNIPRNKSDAEKREKWKQVEEDFGRVDAWLRKNDGNSPFVLGDTPCFSDIIFASFVIWVRIILGEDSPEWKDMCSWHGGRWEKLSAGLKQYEG